MSALSPRSNALATGVAVWDRLWKYRPCDSKDDALLAREVRTPRWSTIVQKLESTFGSIRGLRTIELGSGRGDISALLAQRGARVTLLDNSEAALEEARWRFTRLGLPAEYHRGDMLGSRSRWRGGYDVAISLGVIEHFKGIDRSHVIRAHHDVLQPGGLAIISVPHACCLPYRLWKSYLEFRGWWPYGMELPYTRSEILRRAGEVGFARVETYGSGFWQSVGDQWIKRLLGRGPDWAHVRSILDETMGLVLLMLAWRGGTAGTTDTSTADTGRRSQ